MNSTVAAPLWRHALLAALVLGSLLALISLEPFGQDPAYHDFADRRSLAGVPSFWNVASNLPFLLVGTAGLVFGRRTWPAGGSATWTIFFFGVALVSAGSSWYHWAPSNATLVWDRLPMTVGFMAMFAALLGESLGRKLERAVLLPALLVGLASVLYWRQTDDLRFYAWVQLVPLLTVPVVMALYRARFSHRWLLLVALGLYVAAKLAELFDRELYALSGSVLGGHAAKHLLAAGACWLVLEMLRRRSALA
jgi:hypothetical protein